MKEISLALKILRKSKRIRLMLETIRELSGKVLVFVSSINRFPNMLEKTSKNTLCHNEIVGGGGATG